MRKPRQHRNASKRTSARLGLLASLLSLAGLARAFVNGLAPKGIAFNGASQRFLTPNGVQRNVYFRLENDGCANVSGKVYDIVGRQVASLATTGSCGIGGTQALVWDGTGADHSGVYIYVISAGDKTFSGTVVVIR